MGNDRGISAGGNDKKVKVWDGCSARLVRGRGVTG